MSERTRPLADNVLARCCLAGGSGHGAVWSSGVACCPSRESGVVPGLGWGEVRLVLVGRALCNPPVELTPASLAWTAIVAAAVAAA